jgi:hypothetical protein
VPGDNANTGHTSATPKQNLSGFNVNALPAGTQLLFARGGAWTDFYVMLKNLYATPTQPIVFDSYTPAWGGVASPWLKVSHFVGFEFGHYNDRDNDGGYTLRNLKLDGEGVSDWGLWLRANLRNLTVENLEITRFEIGVHSQSDAIDGVTFFTLRNSNIHHNSSMGMLGSANDSVIDGNTFAYNNFSGSVFSHAIYLGSGSHESRNVSVRGNTFTNNSVCTDLTYCPSKPALTGACDGGNVTVHGQWDGVLIENNRIEQAASTGGCYGFSITTGYNSAEWFRNFVVRGNTVVNLGNCSVCANAAPGILVEDNRFINSQTTYHAGASIGGSTGAGDDVDSGAIVRNNIACFPSSAPYQTVANVSGAGAQVTGNTTYTGAAATTGPCIP